MKYLLAALLGSTLITAPIQIVDGDTVRAGGQIYRLVGFDTPEKGDRAQCPFEQLLAARATERLRELLRSAARHASFLSSPQRHQTQAKQRLSSIEKPKTIPPETCFDR
jgi:endonuclease YncB( thermonuclease family)